MYLIFIISFWLLVAPGTEIEAWCAEAPAMHAPKNTQPRLAQPVKELFSHKSHQAPLEKMNIDCTSCHNFSIKADSSDPLSTQVQGKHLQPLKQICHQCHLGNVSIPRPNQCQLCHADTDSLKPASHYQNWGARHGKSAQSDPDSCKQCHKPQSCSDCHTRRDMTRPMVHRANFRYTHSIEARSNPQKCVLCHQGARFCVDCHSGARQ